MGHIEITTAAFKKVLNQILNMREQLSPNTSPAQADVYLTFYEASNNRLGIDCNFAGCDRYWMALTVKAKCFCYFPQFTVALTAVKELCDNTSAKTIEITMTEVEGDCAECESVHFGFIGPIQEDCISLTPVKHQEKASKEVMDSRKRGGEPVNYLWLKQAIDAASYHLNKPNKDASDLSMSEYHGLRVRTAQHQDFTTKKPVTSVSVIATDHRRLLRVTRDAETDGMFDIFIPTFLAKIIYSQMEDKGHADDVRIYQEDGVAHIYWDGDKGAFEVRYVIPNATPSAQSSDKMMGGWADKPGTEFFCRSDRLMDALSTLGAKPERYPVLGDDIKPKHRDDMQVVELYQDGGQVAVQSLTYVTRRPIKKTWVSGSEAPIASRFLTTLDPRYLANMAYMTECMGMGGAYKWAIKCHPAEKVMGYMSPTPVYFRVIEPNLNGYRPIQAVEVLIMPFGQNRNQGAK